MPISVKCPTCERTATVPDTTAGKNVQCNCGVVFQVSAQPAVDELELQPNEPVSTSKRAVPAVEPISHRRTHRTNTADRRGTNTDSVRSKSDTGYWGADLFDWSLRKMITPMLIRSQYFWGVILWLILCIVAAVGALFVPDMPGGVRLISILGAIIVAYVGLITWRMAAEGMILFFNIYEVLMQIRDSDNTE